MANSLDVNLFDIYKSISEFFYMTNDSDKQKALAKLAGKVMCDRQLLWKLTDKVYELMKEDLQQQKQRIKN